MHNTYHNPEDILHQTLMYVDRPVRIYKVEDSQVSTVRGILASNDGRFVVQSHEFTLTEVVKLETEDHSNISHLTYYI